MRCLRSRGFRRTGRVMVGSERSVLDGNDLKASEGRHGVGWLGEGVDWLGKDGETSDIFCGLDLMKRRAWW